MSKYTLSDDHNANAAVFNSRFGDIDLRLKTLEKLESAVNQATDRLVELGLAKINPAVAEALSVIENVAQLSNLFEARSVSSVAISTGLVEIIIEPEDRPNFAPPKYLVVYVNGQLDVWMAGQAESWNKETGQLYINITDIRGDGVFDDWTVTPVSIPESGPSIDAYTKAEVDALTAQLKTDILGDDVNAALDTISELRAAINDDVDFATTVIALLSGKADLSALGDLAVLNTVGTAQLADNSVSTAKFIQGSITVDKLSIGVIELISRQNSELLAIALRVAALEGDALGVIDGIADPFDDETDVDAGTNLNSDYDVVNDVYQVSSVGGAVDIIPIMTDYTTDGVTVSASNQSTDQNGHTWHAFDDSDLTDWASGTGGLQWLLIDFGETVDFSKYTLQRSINSQSTDSFKAFDFQISDDGINFTTVQSQENLIWTASDEVKTFDLGSDYSARYVRFNDIEALGNTNSWLKTKEIQVLSPAIYGNMLLQSVAFTTEFTPTTARILFQIKPIDSIAINTDLIASVSRDGGETWTAATLVEQLTYSDGTVLYDDSQIDVSGQPTGTSMKWKLETANGKNIKVSGVVLQWS